MRRERWWRTESLVECLPARPVRAAAWQRPLPQWEAFTKPLRNLISPWRLEGLRDRHSAPTT
jgi:hypothetical protein